MDNDDTKKTDSNEDGGETAEKKDAKTEPAKY